MGGRYLGQASFHIPGILSAEVLPPVEIIPKTFSYVFSPYREPIARVAQGQRVIIQCEDAFESRILSTEDLPSHSLANAKFLNPQTGPIYIEGAAGSRSSLTVPLVYRASSGISSGIQVQNLTGSQASVTRVFSPSTTASTIGCLAREHRIMCMRVESRNETSFL